MDIEKTAIATYKVAEVHSTPILIAIGREHKSH